MYQNITSRILHNGASFMFEIGVRQGENHLSLFSLNLNDLQSFLHNNGSSRIEFRDPRDQNLWLKLLPPLYADDTVILSDSPEDFQNSLSSFHNHCKTWHLHVNDRKTKIIILGARRPNRSEFRLGDQIAEITAGKHYTCIYVYRFQAVVHS